jgi:hypothetical protein
VQFSTTGYDRALVTDRGSDIVSRISISEEDLDVSSPVVYGTVGAPSRPDVYGPIDPHTLIEEGSAKIATWVLVVSAIVLSIAFGVGGFVLGQSGRVTKDQVESTRAADRARFAADERMAIATATARVRRADARRTAERVRIARDQGIAKGRRIAENAANDAESSLAAASDSDCLTAVQVC